jgi:hypothetical protein
MQLMAGNAMLFRHNVFMRIIVAEGRTEFFRLYYYNDSHVAEKTTYPSGDKSILSATSS